MRGFLALALCVFPIACYAQHGGFSSSSSGGSRSSYSSSRSGSGGSGGGFTDETWRSFQWIVGVGLVGIGGLVGFAATQVRVIGTLKIIAPPPGEAPEEIRRAWVGVSLPLRKHQSKPVTMPTVGVVSQAQTETATGYAILGTEALAALARHDKKAAEWWYKNARHVCAPGYVLVFPTKVCEKREM